ncbi:MAG: RNA polymerase factor sigma-54 [Phycisphaerales bacterium]|nr:RNA polymerase factor sigma-54 [Phycisphaerales bacterium]
MRFETSQHMKLGQHMKLAPRMIQSMEILQLPMLALQERIEQELASNIALEIAEPTDDDPTDRSGKGDDAVDVAERELVVSDESQGHSDDFARLESFESTYTEASDNEFSSSDLRPDAWEKSDWSRRVSSRLSGERDKKQDAMANAEARPASLTDQLLEQWMLSEYDEPTTRAGKLLISHIDEDGYVRTDLATIADHAPRDDDEPITVELLEETLVKVQRFLEPPGLAARTIVECLLLQLDPIEANDPDLDVNYDLIRTLIEHHLDDLAQNRLPTVAQKTGTSIDEIKTAMTYMRALSLSPARSLVPVNSARIIPDAIIEYDEEQDRYVAALCDGTVPNLRISKVYEDMARDKAVDKKAREFITTNLRNARWLVEAVDQRSSTLMRVIRVVLEAQRDFFDFGPQHLRPLPMTQVADQLGVHVATISRAVSDKWVQTPRGVLALRQFFSGGMETQSGGDKSWEAVKAILGEIIDGEDKDAPFSDDALKKQLSERGIDLARRTVAKYRVQLGIPTARRRKQY